MKNRITNPEQVKPNFAKVKERWKYLLTKFYGEDGELNSKYTINVDCPHCSAAKKGDNFVLNKFYHHTCDDCGCVFVSPRLNDNALKELYTDDYYSEMFSKAMIPFFEKRKTLIGKSKYEQVISVLDSVSKDRKDPLHILDIGAGIGEVIDVFKDNGHSCKAIEVNKVAIEYLSNLGIEVFSDSFFNYDSDKKYDVIMAWGVIEHITNPSSFLKRVYALLSETGVFVSEVPHSQSLLVEYCKRSNKDPLRILQGEQHILLYSKNAYCDIHLESGLKLHHIQTNGLDMATISDINHLKIDSNIVSDIQDSVDDLLNGDLLRGFWLK